jgi:hypothetical protein
MRGKSNFNIEPTVANFPFWMMIVFLSELANLLNESLALFKRIELESFGDGIVAWVIPTFNTASIDNVLDSSLIHFFEFVNAPLIESFEFRVEIVEVFGSQRESSLHFSWHFGFGLKWHQKSRGKLSGLDSFELRNKISGQHFIQYKNT